MVLFIYLQYKYLNCSNFWTWHPLPLYFWRFIIGFFLAGIPWYIGAFVLLCARYDHREKPGYVACTIAVSRLFISDQLHKRIYSALLPQNAGFLSLIVQSVFRLLCILCWKWGSPGYSHSFYILIFQNTSIWTIGLLCLSRKISSQLTFFPSYIIHFPLFQIYCIGCTSSTVLCMYGHITTLPL